MDPLSTTLSALADPTRVMPGWLDRLGETTVKELTVYVHSLGGGQ